ncbi:hypothetical protein B0H14DRAFT_3483868 [Mycena olivaceomarginata]|nr:hypothetical protein B0H14DRAFT_3483868 [Mycena olivaceomarginata]
MAPKSKRPLPPHVGHVGFDSYTTVDIDLPSTAENQDSLPDAGIIFEIERTPPISPSKHHKKRAAQWHRWDQEIIPLLIPHYSWVRWETKSFHELEKLPTPAQDCDCIPRIQTVAIMRFSSVKDMQVPVCKCRLAAVSLVRGSAFPCAPLQLSLAVDLRVLEFAFKLFLNIAPNHTALSTTLETVLSTMWYQLNQTVDARDTKPNTNRSLNRNPSPAQHVWGQPQEPTPGLPPTTPSRSDVSPLCHCASTSTGVLHTPTAQIHLSQTHCHIAAQANIFAVVNTQTRGEQQYYVITLLETLFQHLPRDITVGILCDIACTLERSYRKWGFLSRFIDHIQFAVSVFHTFGHDWPCQLLYHPRKRTSHLIAVLRISGKWQWLYVLDAQIEHADELSLQRLGDWLRRRSLHSRKKRQEAESVLAECRVRISVLREQWQLQVSAQTKPLPCRSKNKGQQAINAILLLRSADADKEADYYQVEFDKVDAARAKAEKTLHEKECALGVGECQALSKMSHIQYYNARMNARATKRRLCDRLRQRKFKLDLVERSFLTTEYNKQCAKVAQLIRDKNAPRGAFAPHPIPDSQLWKLDVDDEIWEDVGLDDDETEQQTTPPLWLCDDGVHAGIKALLPLDQRQFSDTGPNRYQYKLMRDDLVRLCATWQKSLPDCGLDTSTLPPWGPDATQRARAKLDTCCAARGEDRHYNIDEEDFSDEEEGYESGGENEVFSMLDTLATADAYREEDVDSVDKQDDFSI